MTTLATLRRFDATHNGSVALSDLGLILRDPAKAHSYKDTPTNGIVFAGTGGDGVHFCLLDVGDGITDESPVIMVVPCNPDCPRMVVGDSLREFLALGCVIGFFFLEQLTYNYDREETVQYLFDWDAFIQHSYFDGAPPEEELSELLAQRQLLHELSAEFSLAPWRDAESRLAELQAKWLAHVRLSG